MVPEQSPQAGCRTKSRNRAPKALKSGLLVAARVQDHLHQVEARFHIWIAIHAILAISCLLALTLYFL